MDEKPPRRRLRFGLRTLFELIAIVAFILTLLYYRQPEPTGTYEFHVVNNRVMVFDTKTGEVWRLASDESQWYTAPKLPAVP